MRNHGHTLIELLCVLALLAILCTLSIGMIPKQMEHYYLEHDAKLLLHTLDSARTTAILSQKDVQLLYNNQTITVQEQKTEQQYKLSGKTQLSFNCFPTNKQKQVHFSPEGFTHFQNGTFTLTSPAGFQQYVVINQAGRTYIKK